MINDRSSIVNEISRLARQMFCKGDGVVYLYGSRARNDARSNSDWDILIITDDAITTADGFAQFAFPYAEIGWRHGEQITPIHYTRSQWEAEKGSAFYMNVLADAIRL